MAEKKDMNKKEHLNKGEYMNKEECRSKEEFIDKEEYMDCYVGKLEAAFTKIMKKLGPQMSNLEGGLTPPQFYVLGLLRKKQLTVTEMADLMQVQPSAITAILDRMHRSGFILRERSEIDRRVVVVKITEKGKEAHVKSQKKRLIVMKEYFSQFEKEELELLLNIYEKMARITEDKSKDCKVVEIAREGNG